MQFDEQKLKEILLRENYVTQEDIANAEEFSKTHHTGIVDYLITKGILTKELLGQAVAESFHLPFANLAQKQPSPEQIMKIPVDIARKYRTIFYEETEKTVAVATDNPTQPGFVDEIKTLFPNKEVTLAYAFSEDIDPLFLYYRKPLETRFSEIMKTQVRVAPEIIGEIFEDALAYHASDIHFEPQEQEIIIRFRIDGVLHEAGRVSKERYENILNRIKVQSHLRIDEHFSAQDGALRYHKVNGEVVDMRISVLPTLDGEKVVIRLLSEYVRRFTLGDLGLSEHHQKVLVDSIQKPFGMILVTGPTGSGKTTTLYALVKFLNNPEINITTIEDPVEYKIPGVNQIQVNAQTNLTFSEGLRSIARQDPNIILVGEIRDKETSEIAVNAALTGHLLFSTFHANDAATAIPRLLDMGVEPFLMASTIQLLVAQRLVRKICENCRRSLLKTQSELLQTFSAAPRYFSEQKETLYEGKGCKGCNNTGFKGRTAIFEFIRVTPELQELILQNPSTQQIWQLARTQGARSLFEDGVLKVKNGITTLSELVRVATPPRE